MPWRSISDRRMFPSMSTVTRAATFTAASQPSMSRVASVSATPISCAFWRAASNSNPDSMPSRMTLVVELRTPRKPCKWTTGRFSWNREKNRHAIEDGGFEQKAAPALRGQVAQFAIGVHDRALVGGDGVGAVLEGEAQVVK